MTIDKTITEAINKYGDYPETLNAISMIANSLKENKMGYMCKEHGFIPYDEIDPCDIPY